ncbi:MAG: hypothetical protein JW791_00285 [Nanoarchaeota archaeon]|nr:hypothetical protein [Nanoarchaeota archaeon]
MLAVISSKSDLASSNIKDFLYTEGYELITVSDALNYDGPTFEFNIFVSKHESSKGVKSLTCHAPGNFGEAEFGGYDKILSVSNALLQTECLKRLNQLNIKQDWSFEVSFEVTHHGPSLNAACLFVEIGSSLLEWSNLEYCKGVAKVVDGLVRDYKTIKSEDKKIGIGIGGPHYAHSFTSLVLKDDSVAIGHVCPDYALNSLDKKMFKQMLDKTVPKPSIVFFNKSVKSEKRKEIVKWCEEFKLSHERLK